jgi:two-component system CheB/CheR fusion protein
LQVHYDSAIYGIPEIAEVHRKLQQSSRSAAAPNDPVLEALPQGVLVLDADLRVLRVNPRYAEIAADDAEEGTVGRTLFELSRGLWDRPDLRSLVDRARAGQGGSVDLEVGGGSVPPRPLRVHVRPIPAPAGAAERLLVLVDDAAGLEHPRQTRAPDGGAWGDIIARAAHELRGPLGSISNWVHLLSQGSQDPALQQQGLAAIQRALNVATRLIETLNDVSLLGAGRLTLRPVLVDLASIVDMALERPRSAAREKGVRLDYLREVASVPLMGDPDRLQQIVLNLIANAVQCTPAGGRVEISIGREASCWRLAVADTGRGIAPDVLPRIFGGLRAGDFVAPRPPATLGAGLTIVRHLAELHGGSVEATSPGPGLGARFVVRFPVTALAASTRPSSDAETRQPAKARPGSAAPNRDKAGPGSFARPFQPPRE